MSQPAAPATAELPERFREAAAALRSAQVRTDAVVRTAPAPTRVAPFAEAITLDIGELATARLVLLHDPAGQDAWQGTDRLVGFARSSVEPEMAGDPLLAEVVWSWFLDALAAQGVTPQAAAGTVTITSNTRFGAIASSGAAHDLELRCSWSPEDSISEHVTAFADLLANMAGLPPQTPGVISLPRRT